MNAIQDYIAQINAPGSAGILPAPPPAAPPCPVCAGTGYYVLDVEPGHEKFGRAIACTHCGRMDYATMFLTRSGLSDTEQRYQIAYPPTVAAYPAAVTAVQTATTTRSGVVALFGGYGVGKSGLLRAAVAATCRAGIRAYYLTAASFLDQVRSTFNNNTSATSETIINRYVNAPLLAIDEFDRGTSTDFALTAIGDLFDRRYRRRHELATLIASNTVTTGPAGILPLPDSMAYIRDRLSDATCVLMLGESQRFAGHWS